MMKTSNTIDLRRSSVMPGKGQMYKKPMSKKAKVMPMKKTMKKKGK